MNIKNKIFSWYKKTSPTTKKFIHLLALAIFTQWAFRTFRDVDVFIILSGIFVGFSFEFYLLELRIAELESKKSK